MDSEYQVSTSTTTFVTQIFGTKDFINSLHVSYLANFMSYTKCNIVVYTDPLTASDEEIKEIISAASNRISFITSFDFRRGNPDILRYGMTEDSFLHFLEKQHNLDPNKDVRGVGDYAKLLSKTFALMETIKRNPFRSSFFFWIDLDDAVLDVSLKEEAFDWVEPRIIERIFEGQKEKLPLFAYKLPLSIRDIRMTKFMNPNPREIVGGKFT